MVNIQRLTKLLRQVPDSYEDFVYGVAATVKNRNDEYLCNELIKLMENNPQASSSDVLEREFEIYKPWEEHPENYVIEEIED